MKKVYMILFTSLLIFYFSGCSSTGSTKNQYKQELDEFKQEYIQNNELNVIWERKR